MNVSQRADIRQNNAQVPPSSGLAGWIRPLGYPMARFAQIAAR
jgi:hypothetical protein